MPGKTIETVLSWKEITVSPSTTTAEEHPELIEGLKVEEMKAIESATNLGNSMVTKTTNQTCDGSLAKCTDHVD